MSAHVVRRFCSDCGQQRPFEKDGVNHLLHLICTVVSLGCWAIVWGLCVLGNMLKPYRCRDCGKTRR